LIEKERNKGRQETERQTEKKQVDPARLLRGMTIILYINQILYLLFTTAYRGPGSGLILFI